MLDGGVLFENIKIPHRASWVRAKKGVGVGEVSPCFFGEVSFNRCPADGEANDRAVRATHSSGTVGFANEGFVHRRSIAARGEDPNAG